MTLIMVWRVNGIAATRLLELSNIKE